MTATPRTSRMAMLAIAVAALGYFVDVYDLLLFSIIRVPSLTGLGVGPDDMLKVGVHLINMQMTGLLLGGFLWGVLGDRIGRRSVLFGSIVLYSTATLANAFVQSVDQYAWLRLIAGIGLAGELGAGITLVSEMMSREARGYGTTIVASFGLLGAVAAALVGGELPWRTAFMVGGALGLVLLALRIGVAESGMFETARRETGSRGNILNLFWPPKRFARYLAIILVAMPTWFSVGILVTFSPEFGKAMGMAVLPVAGRAVMWNYLGISLGDLLSGLLSQRLRSRRKAILIFQGLTALAVAFYFLFGGRSITTFYTACVALGITTGYWAVFVTVAAEQFGTNMRATAATTAPNMVRGGVVILTSAFTALKVGNGVIGSGIIVGTVTLAVAVTAALTLAETYGKDLDYLEP